MRVLFRAGLAVWLCLAVSPILAQHGAARMVQEGLDSLRKYAPLERIHIQLDKANYVLGDTVWYKVFVLDGTTGVPSPVSGIVYTELIDGNGELVRRSRLVVLGGAAHGEFVLDPLMTSPGQFAFRAYTQWLQNFGPDYYGYRTIEVSGDYTQEWAVDFPPISIDSGNPQEVGIALRIRRLDGRPFEPIPVTASLMLGTGAVAQKRVAVAADGQLQIDFGIPPDVKAADLELVLASGGQVKARVPLSAGMPHPDYDVQFLPESGHWLSGVPTVLGIKAVGRDGKGVPVTGTILGPDGAVITEFACRHRGMGRAELPALPRGKYLARVVLPDGREMAYSLPDQVEDGVVLHYDERLSRSSRIALQVMGAESAFGNGLLLTGQVRGVLCYGRVITVADNFLFVHVNKEDLPEGVIQFALLDEKGHILAERKVFHYVGRAAVKADVMSHKDRYGVRDSVALRLNITDRSGKPVRGNFAMAVTDNGRYPPDSLMETIRSRFLLTSALQGVVEAPGFYLSSDTVATKAVDDLMLTQGWVRYDQSLLARLRDFTHQREPYFRIAGQVKSGFNKPLAGTRVTLAAVGKTPFVADTLTDANGWFRFERFPVFDTLGFVITALNKRDKQFSVGVELLPDARPAPMPKRVADTSAIPWYVNLDTGLERRIDDQRQQFAQQVFSTEGGDLRAIMLQEANVTARKRVQGSWNLNGPGMADLVLTEADLLEAGRATLLDVLAKHVEGFQVGIFPRGRGGKPAYVVGPRPVRIMIDGMSIDHFYEPEEAMTENDYLLYVKNYLEQYTADELRGIEVMTDVRFSSRYMARFVKGTDFVATSGAEQFEAGEDGTRVNQLSATSRSMGYDPVYIEVTTRGGKGLFNRRTPGLVHFNPMPFAWPREFYRPRYGVANQSAEGEDYRSTIHWEPFIITDEKGEAIVTFFTADLPGTYTIHVEGLDDEGNLIVLDTKLLVGDAVK